MFGERSEEVGVSRGGPRKGYVNFYFGDVGGPPNKVFEAVLDVILCVF